MTKRVLAIHDLCSFGRCSLTAAMPIISAMGSQVCPFPTAWFSNNLTYGDFHFDSFTEKMSAYLDQWQKLGYKYDAIYSGFLSGADQVALVRETIELFGTSQTLTVVDPAMGDNGALYPIFDAAMVESMKGLIAQAALITPNFTEACLLLGLSLDGFDKAPVPGKEELLTMCRALAALGPKYVVVTSVPGSADTIRTVSYEATSDTMTEHVVKRIGLTTCGTGDIFASVVTGALMRDLNLQEAVALALDFAETAIAYTHETGADVREGVQFEPCLAKLIERTRDA